MALDEDPEQPRVLESSDLDPLGASIAAVNLLDARMKEAEGSAGETFRRRKEYSRFSEADARLLEELDGIFRKHAREIVDRFYDRLLDYEELQVHLPDPGTIERLKKKQIGYLHSLTSGRYDDDYARGRRAIGRVHDRIGLEADWYLGTYGLYLDLLLPLVQEHFKDDPPRAVQASAALTKLMVLDMQLVLDSYYGLREKKAVERSEQLAAVGELAASIAHEVRNPLAGMKGALEVLRKELSVKPENLEIVDELLAQITRLEHLVRDLLTYARPHALSCQYFDLHELLDRLLRSYKEKCDEVGITVHRIYGPATGRLWADPRQMEQVCLNLLHNGMQAMERGGTLTVMTRRQRGGVQILFSDSGVGLPPGATHKVFQPFFTTKHRGSGLGLPIVKRIAEAHGGSIVLTSKPGEGTTATVTVPLQRDIGEG